MKKTLSIFLILAFLSSPGYALAPSLVSDPGINPGRSAQLQADIATKLEPGAIGNGAPLRELAEGKLPPRATLAGNEYNEIAQKLREAITLAMKAGAENEKEVPPEHAARAQQALVNLLLLQYNLSTNAYLFNADVRGPEDYLLGFNRANDRGYAIELIKLLPTHRLAQYLYHECIPENGIVTERDDHRVVYNEIQSAIFGKDEALALKKDLRGFINGRIAVGPGERRVVLVPKGTLLSVKAGVRVRPPAAIMKGNRMKRWWHASLYARHFKAYSRGTRKDITNAFSRFEVDQQTELFELINRAFSYSLRNDYVSMVDIFKVIRSATDFDEIKNDIEFCIKTRSGISTLKSLPQMRKNIADTEMREIWLDLAAQLVSKGMHPPHIIAEGSVIAEVCGTSQELRAVAALIADTAQMLIREREAAVTVKEAKYDSSGEFAIDKFLAKTLAVSKNVTDLAINLKYLEIIAVRMLQEPSEIYMAGGPTGFHVSWFDVGKLILEARRLNMSGQGFDIVVERETYCYPTDEDNNTVVTTDKHQEVKIIPGAIRVPIVNMEGLPVKEHVTPRRDLDEKITDTGNTKLLGAIGNGVPLAELAQGKLPSRAAFSDTQYQEFVKQLTEAIGLAVKLSVANENKVPPQHQARARETLANLMILQDNLLRDLYLFNADISSPEDYLLGFNKGNQRGFAVELVKTLYEMSPARLAQYVYHECVPEKGMPTERDDHRAVYNEIQSVIFGQDEVIALKRDLRELINKRVTAQISEALPLRAKIFAANLTQILSQNSDQLFFMGIETDIGLDQKAQIMPIYKAIDEIREMKTADGKPLFPNLMVKRGKAADLVTEVASLKEDGKLALNNTFIGARKLSVDNKLYDSIKGEGMAWIAAIDDSRMGDYLPVFESITLSMMAYLNADISAIKNFYDALSDKPIDSTALQNMIKNRIIYILPKATKFDIKQLRELYELAQQLHTAA